MRRLAEIAERGAQFFCPFDMPGLDLFHDVMQRPDGAPVMLLGFRKHRLGRRVAPQGGRDQCHM
ncbi:hypothetical protein CKO19_10500 [Rhodovulum adriaticum]|nr:hypothetical protein [Rhodovulum adriaticum]